MTPRERHGQQPQDARSGISLEPGEGGRGLSCWGFKRLLLSGQNSAQGPSDLSLELIKDTKRRELMGGDAEKRPYYNEGAHVVHDFTAEQTFEKDTSHGGRIQKARQPDKR